MNTKSTWKLTSEEPPQFPPLNNEIVADVVIVGAGITGLMLANLLGKTNRKIVLLEAKEVGAGTTGYSSNHLTTDIDFGYRNVKKKFSEKVMSLVAKSRVQALDLIEQTCSEHAISCDFARVDGFLYTEEEEKVKIVEEEYKYALSAGLEVEEVGAMDLPFPVKKIINYRRQGVINTQKFLNGLATVLSKGDNCDIYCNSRVVEVDNSNKRVITDTGSVTAEHIILATHTPQFINILHTMVEPYRSYILALKLPSNKYPAGLYWDSKEPYHYTRSYSQGEESWLLVGGADHKTGENGKDHFTLLEQYARQRYGSVEVVHKWSAQYYEPADGLPYIGKSPLSNVYVATGFSGDGLVYGVVAAIILAAQISGEEHDWLQAYNARRFTPLASGAKFVKHNLSVGKHLIKGLLQSEELSALSAGQGKIINYEGNKYAVSKDSEGKIIAVSAVCPHMGCIVQWNNEEYSWDCPCHGSRFEQSGKRIEGPAVKDLEQQSMD